MRTIKKRRQENKTDYLKRLKLLKSGKPRVVLRRTNKYFILQYVTSHEAMDKVELGMSSKILLKYGWPETAKGSLNSLSAAYLTGYLFGKEIKNKKLAEPIVDFGMIRMLHKSRVYGILKGLVDSGLELKHKAETFPDESRIKGEHMKNKIPFDEIKSKIDKA